MARGYQINEIKEKLIDILQNSKTGFTGVEMAEKMGVNRITVTKYLNIFAAEGFLKQKSIGKISLWYLEDGVELLHFPDDFFRVQSKFFEYLTSGSKQQAFNLIRNSYHSGALPKKIITEVIVPAIDSINEQHKDGSIGNSEKNFLDGLVSNSIQILNSLDLESDYKKNVTIISADSQSELISEAASAALHVDGWQVSHLGNLSSAIDVMFDIDLQKFLNKIWKPKQGIMIVIVFSSTQEGLKFFSEAVISCKAKFGKTMYLALCSNLAKKDKTKIDFVSEDLENLLQWSDTTYESYLGKK